MAVVNHNDGSKNKALVFTTKHESVATIIFLPAMGVRVIYYKRFLECLRLAGFNIVTMDWRGSGSSDIRPNHKTDFGYERLIQDVKDLVELANAQFPFSKKIITGHSLGGQIATLFASRFPHLLSSLVLITTCNVHYTSWTGLDKLKLLIAGCTFYSISLILGHFPGSKIGFAGNEAKMVMKDWCNNALTGNYRLSASDFNYDKALELMIVPVLSISINNDRLASKKAVLKFLNKLKHAYARHIHLTEEHWDKPLDHFSWAKAPHQLTQIIIKELNLGQ